MVADTDTGMIIVVLAGQHVFFHRRRQTIQAPGGCDTKIAMVGVEVPDIARLIAQKVPRQPERAPVHADRAAVAHLPYERDGTLRLAERVCAEAHPFMAQRIPEGLVIVLENTAKVAWITIGGLRDQKVALRKVPGILDVPRD